MPYADILENGDIARKPDRGENNMADINKCNCGCQNTTTTPDNGYACPPFWPWPPRPDCPPPPPPYPGEWPGPVCPTKSSVEAQIAKLAKKSATIRAMIDALKNKNKPILISIGGKQYNFGCYLDAEQSATDYGTTIETMLEKELEAIKTKLTELTEKLNVEDSSDKTETTVTM